MRVCVCLCKSVCVCMSEERERERKKGNQVVGGRGKGRRVQSETILSLRRGSYGSCDAGAR